MVTLLVYPSNQFCRDHFEVIFAHDLQSAVVGGERIIKRHFVIVQAEIDAALIRGVHFLGELDQFFNHLLCCDRVAPFAEGFRRRGDLRLAGDPYCARFTEVNS